ncbi:hypothetical protein NDI56_03960 [Haloarcula sp. S1CR25-12]|uniref:Tail assembly chaperone n=1 Tax=Haloarcula saliterrae TaxID=2950534 RepID=A0ABU2F9P5_9EURY|nr:hypothetical protein [Haloarcula sp. S1CR25-12]MDS0258565.1 hypothetical protein [Haloarcula sp. S1CR25-12]
MTTFNDTEINFDDEEQRLQERIDELEAGADSLREQIQNIQSKGNDVPQAKRDALQQAVSEASTLSTHRKGVVWARDHAADSDDFPAWDEAADSITLGAPRARTIQRLQSDIQSAGDTQGSEQSLYIADAVVEAPFKDDGMADGELAGVVGQLHPWFLEWAEDRVDALMDPEGNVPSSAASPAEMSTPNSSTEE